MMMDGLIVQWCSRVGMYTNGYPYKNRSHHKACKYESMFVVYPSWRKRSCLHNSILASLSSCQFGISSILLNLNHIIVPMFILYELQNRIQRFLCDSSICDEVIIHKNAWLRSKTKPYRKVLQGRSATNIEKFLEFYFVNRISRTCIGDPSGISFIQHEHINDTFQTRHVIL